MTKLMTTLTITIMTTILLTGGIAPYAFSNGGYDDDDDDLNVDDKPVFSCRIQWTYCRKN